MTETEWQAATTEEEYFVVHPAHVTAGEQALITADRYALGCAGLPRGRGLRRVHSSVGRAEVAAVRWRASRRVCVVAVGFRREGHLRSISS